MISYADLVESIFGYWPEFADAKIVEFAWSKGGTLRLVIDYIDAQQSKRATVSLLFSGVAEVELTELRSENVLDLLVIGSDDPIEVEIVPCAGVGGTFKCTAVEVTGVVPNHSVRDFPSTPGA